MKELLNHLEYTKLFLTIAVGVIALTYLIHIIFKKTKIVKFIPGILSVLIGMYGLLNMDGKIIFLDDIDNLTIFIMGVSIGLIGIFVAIIIGILNKNKKRRVKKEK